jgi:hypothetical protein
MHRVKDFPDRCGPSEQENQGRLGLGSSLYGEHVDSPKNPDEFRSGKPSHTRGFLIFVLRIVLVHAFS